MRFITDTHLGKLAKYLRLLGFDTLHFTQGSDAELANLAQTQGRILLTRDRMLHARTDVTSYFPINIDTEEQLKEVLAHFDLCKACRPFSRCMICNGMVREIADPSTILDKLPEKVREFHTQFWQCEKCKKIYWHGTHYKRMKERIASFCP